jgi:hypothetical protein
MTDPITIATITAAVSVLGNEYLKGIASDAAKSTWQSIKSLFGWKADPEPSSMAADAAEKLCASPELVEKILQLLNDAGAIGTAGAMVGRINAKNVIVSKTITTQKLELK